MNLWEQALSTYPSMTRKTGRQKSGTKSVAYFAVIIVILGCCVLFAGCTGTGTTAKQVVKPNDTVRVHYTLSINGTKIESSVNKTPLEFTLGNKTMIKGFEQAVIGMSPGENKTVTIPAKDAYGDWKQEYVVSLNRSQYPDLDPKAGDRISYTLTNGQKGTVKVLNVSESMIVVDANHPLAGQDLTFDIQLVEIVKTG